MKPLRLTIAGLHSFRDDVTIDFEELMRDGLFGIFGPTGSGKSTLLDAITLALYGRVRRAPANIQGIINARVDSCTVSFTFEAGHQDNRRRYRAERSLRRKPDGRIDTRRRRLVDCSDAAEATLAEREAEMREIVSEILGITADDFLRAVVLPQGAFAEFLSLEPRERNAMLQRLFDLQSYGDPLLKSLKERQNEISTRRASVEGALEALAAYDDEAVARDEADVTARRAELDEATAADEKARARHDELRGLKEKLDELQQLRDAQADRERERRDLELTGTRLERARAAAAVAPWIEGFRRASLTADEAAARFRESDRLHAEAQMRHARLSERWSSLRTETETRRARLERAIEALRTGVELEAEMKSLRASIEKCETDITRASAALAELTTGIETLERGAEERRAEISRLTTEQSEKGVTSEERRRADRLRTARQRLTELTTRRHQLATSLAEGEKKIEALRLSCVDQEKKRATGELEVERIAREIETADRLRTDTGTEREELRNAYTRDRDWIVKLEDRIARRVESEQALARVRSEREALEAQRTVARQERVTAVQELRRAETERERIVALIEEDRRESALAGLVGLIRDGDPCPLCGSHEHPHPFHRDAAGERVADAAGYLKREEERVRECDQKVRDVDKQIGTCDGLIETKDLEIARLATRQDEELTAERLLLQEIFAEDETPTLEHLRERLSATQAAGERAASIIRDCEASLVKLRTSRDEMRSAVATAEREMAAIVARIEAAEQQNESWSREISKLDAAVAAEEALFTSEGITLEGVDELVRGIDEREERCAAIARELETLRGKEGDEARRLASMVEQRQASEKMLSGFESEKGLHDKRIAELDARLRELLIDHVEEADRSTAVDRLLAMRREEKEELERTWREADEEHRRSEREASDAAVRVEAARSEERRSEEQRGSAREKVDEELRRLAFATIEEATAAAIEDGEREMLERDHRSRCDAVERDERRCSELASLLEGKGVDEKELQQGAAEAEAAAERRARAGEAHAVAADRLTTCREKNREWRAARDRDADTARERATADQLMKYLRGNGFVDFLANERLGDVCRAASRLLLELTSGRLEVSTRPGEGFIIIDHGNGGNDRLPSSLSGGETFLVSLALALSLSDTMQQGRAPLEFFFLDEGFGTLDSELLDTVMTSLEKLRSSRRAIGVISHVGQLRERITRRLVVTPPTDLEGSSVALEVA